MKRAEGSGIVDREPGGAASAGTDPVFLERNDTHAAVYEASRGAETMHSKSSMWRQQPDRQAKRLLPDHDLRIDPGAYLGGRGFMPSALTASTLPSRP